MNWKPDTSQAAGWYHIVRGALRLSTSNFLFHSKMPSHSPLSPLSPADSQLLSSQYGQKLLGQCNNTCHSFFLSSVESTVLHLHNYVFRMLLFPYLKTKKSSVAFTDGVTADDHCGKKSQGQTGRIITCSQPLRPPKLLV